MFKLQSHHKAVEESNQNEPDVFECEKVNLLINGTILKCIVLNKDDDAVTLVPQQELPFEQSAMIETSAQIETAQSTADFKISSFSSVPVIIGTQAACKAQSTTDQRNFFRIRPDFKIEISLDDKSWHTVPGLDLSEGGLLAVNNDAMDLSVGQLVTLRLHLPDFLTITANGVIKRLVYSGDNNNRFVVQFTDISSEERHQLVRFIYQFQVERSLSTN